MKTQQQRTTLAGNSEHQISPILLGQRAIVQCHSFRCLGVRGPDGQWRDMRGTRLEVLEVVEELP